ncbi:MAG: response regulator [Deltaproteobacteria bacterium]|jgi:putative two-component system response regulator|nr:response regulator [Deltaproteobacteria bacterium]
MEDRKKIILVDDATNLSMGKSALCSHFDVLTVPSSEKLFQALRVFSPNLILLDVDMPGTNSFKTIRLLKAEPETAEVPIILLSARYDYASHEMKLALGAADFVVKPYPAVLLINMIRRHIFLATQRKQIAKHEGAAGLLAMQRRSLPLDLQNSLLDTLIFLSENSAGAPAIQGAGHIYSYLSAMTAEMRRKGIYSEELSRWNEETLIASAQLHDIGKLFVRDEILQKPGRLTLEEFAAVKSHTAFGVEMIEAIEYDVGKRTFLDSAKLFAAAHHERWNGSGYPLGLRERDIPFQGRLMAIVDVYNALVSDRPYKRPFSHKAAQEIIMKGRRIHFDPLLSDVFLSVSNVFAAIIRKERP